MRTWSIILGITIFVCIVSVSFSHTVDLYLRVGFVLWEAILATIAIETTFLLSGWSILWYRMQRKSPGKSAYVGFFFGVFMVLFSNSAYTVGLNRLFENNVAQWTLAFSVVACVGISESIISQNLLGRKMDKSTNQLADHRSKMADQPASRSTTISQVSGQKSASQPSGRKAAESGRNVSRQVQPSTSHISQSDQPVAESVSQVAEVAEKVVEADQPAASQVAETSSQSTAKSASGRPTVSRPSATNRTKVVDMADRKVADQKVVEVAEKYYRENGELPSRRRLAEMADCTPYRAEKAINFLKEKYNINQSANRSASGR